jgi:hypothetical protein
MRRPVSACRISKIDGGKVGRSIAGIPDRVCDAEYDVDSSERALTMLLNAALPTRSVSSNGSHLGARRLPVFGELRPPATLCLHQPDSPLDLTLDALQHRERRSSSAFTILGRAVPTT